MLKGVYLIIYVMKGSFGEMNEWRKENGVGEEEEIERECAKLEWFGLKMPNDVVGRVLTERCFDFSFDFVNQIQTHMMETSIISNFRVEFYSNLQTSHELGQLSHLLLIVDVVSINLIDVFGFITLGYHQ